MLSSDYINTLPSDATPKNSKNSTVVLCEGCFVNEQQRFEFVSQNFQEADIDLFRKQKSPLYGSVGFPFESVEATLASHDRTDFLYVVFNSCFDFERLIYDEYVYKNFPTVVSLFKKMRQGGDIIVFKKANEDLLFVKIHNIYEGPELLHMSL